MLPFLPDLTSNETLLDALPLVCLPIAWFFPRLGGQPAAVLEKAAARFAARKRLAIVMMALAPIVLRLSLLPLIPVPVPTVHDEFSYLLAADTFAHGRLTNPPHPMSAFFETMHVNQHPTYMSKYPPAQGAVLALGQLLGHPWIGVLLSVSAMCAGTLWMLQGWFAARWALVGAMLLLMRVGIFSYWMNSYWGGAVAATGGALVMGALPRIFRYQRTRDALLLGVGAAILANSRPFEGFVFLFPVSAVLLAWLCGKRSPSWRQTLPRVVLPLGATLLLTVIFIGYYNWRVTGSPAVLPYTVNERTYAATPLFVWQKARQPLVEPNPQMEVFYNQWAPGEWAKLRVDSVQRGVRVLGLICWAFINFFLWPKLCVPLLALPSTLRDRRIRFFLVQAAVCFCGFLLVGWFWPHYAAPLAVSVFAILLQAFRHLRRWEFRGRALGIAVTRMIILLAVFLAPTHRQATSFIRGDADVKDIESRAALLKQLSTTPGQHVIIVRYGKEHDVGEEWVYNRADPDRANVVWAREIPGVDMHPLLSYFQGRQFWLVEPDSDPAQLRPYSMP